VNITTKNFWEKYWGEIVLPQKANLKFKNDRIIADSFNKIYPEMQEDDLALEVGCAPGKWLIYVYEKFGCRVEGFEYLDIAAKKTEENLRKSNVPENKFLIKSADFLIQCPEPKYALVFSFGFIEHFNDYQDIFVKHLLYAKDGGSVVIGFPIFRGVNFFIQYIIDLFSKENILENHNLNIMNKKVVLDMVRKSGASLVYCDYVGGFEPSLFNVLSVENKLVRVLVKILLKLFGWFFGRWNCRFATSYLVCVVKK
jgi:SAM-dependent methyltransferase